MRELVCQYTLRVYSLTNNIYLWECMQIKRTTFLTVLLVYIQLLFFQSWSNYIYQYNKLHTIADTKLRIHAQLGYQGLAFSALRFKGPLSDFIMKHFGQPCSHLCENRAEEADSMFTWAPSIENVSSGVCDPVTFKPACAATEAS